MFSGQAPGMLSVWTKKDLTTGLARLMERFINKWSGGKGEMEKNRLKDEETK